jgi:hypothetical protein
MEKKRYSKPSMMVEKFIPQEYVAACTYYDFYCHVPDFATGDLYRETNLEAGFQMRGPHADKFVQGSNYGTGGEHIHLTQAQYDTIFQGYCKESYNHSIPVLVYFDGKVYHSAVPEGIKKESKNNS